MQVLLVPEFAHSLQVSLQKDRRWNAVWYAVLSGNFFENGLVDVIERLTHDFAVIALARSGELVRVQVNKVNAEDIRFLGPKESEHLEIRILESGSRGAQTDEGLVVFQFVIVLVVEAHFIVSEFIRQWVILLVLGLSSILGAWAQV